MTIGQKNHANTGIKRNLVIPSRFQKQTVVVRLTLQRWVAWPFWDHDRPYACNRCGVTKTMMAGHQERCAECRRNTWSVA